MLRVLGIVVDETTVHTIALKNIVTSDTTEEAIWSQTADLMEKMHGLHVLVPIYEAFIEEKSLHLAFHSGNLVNLCAHLPINKLFNTLIACLFLVH